MAVTLFLTPLSALWRSPAAMMLLLVGVGTASSACSDTPAGTGQGVAGANGDIGVFRLDVTGLDIGAQGGDAGGSADPGAAGTDAGQNSDVAASTDTATADAPKADTAKPDVGAVSDFGQPCKSDSDCQSGWCIEGYSGYFCSQTCTGSCPKGFVCNKVYADKTSQPVLLCMAPVNKLCKPCISDLDCAGGACIDNAGEQFCATPCGGSLSACPASHTCKPQQNPDGSPGNPVCMPNSGTCACTAKSSGLIRACQVASGPQTCYGIETCNAGTWTTCQLPAEVCNGQDDDCDGTIDDGFVDATGKYATLQACGQCGNNCAVLQGPNAQPTCVVTAGVAQCKLACDAGWLDVDDNPKTGCECLATSTTDLPDGPDQNCDGIDGEVNNGVFVALTGNDANLGTWTLPMASVGAAIGKAKASGRRDVYVASGVYAGSIALVEGVHVYGGYSADFKKHEALAYETVILGGKPSALAPGAVNCLGLQGGKATFDGFSVYALSVKDKGASSYGIYVRDCEGGVRLTKNRVVSGDGGAGTPGTAGGNGELGTGGGVGSAAKDIAKATCSAADNSPGGKGGVHTCGGSDVSGGSGGTSVCPDYDEDGTQPKSSPYKQTLSATEQGIAGKGTGAGKGGASGYDGIIWEGSSSACGICNPPKLKDGNPFLYTLGKNGGDGGDGATGSLGAGCTTTAGTLVGNLWTPASASVGGAGAAGAGGGGGGAGGGVEVTPACKADDLFKNPDIGGSGGGGGAGGCGGTGGKPGGSGGGSFALFLVFTAVPAALPDIAGNQLITGNGGDGGPGGLGGVGGLGGDGQFGGGDDPAGLAWCASGGGRGGQGGNGGHGGGGGGGCGGASYGIFLAGAAASGTAALATKNTVQILGVPGTGGAGGKSLGKTGGDGATGAGGATNL